MPEPVRVNKPSRAHSPSWVSRLRGLTCRRRASSWPLHARGGWLVMMAVISSRRVDGWGGRGCAAVAAGLAGLEVDGRGADGDVDRGNAGGMGWAAVVAVQVPGGGAFDLAGAVPGGRAGSKVARTARPMALGRSPGRPGRCRGLR